MENDTMKPVVISFPPPNDSQRSLPSSISQPQPSAEQTSFAAKRALILFGCYRKGDANDPETYTAAITAVLAEYSPEVIQRVTDPRTGLPRTMKFMPNVAEVSEACENAKLFLAAEAKLKAQGWHWNGERYVQSP